MTDSLHALLAAGGFSEQELARLTQAALGVELNAIAPSALRQDKLDELIMYATVNDVRDNLLTAILQAGSDRPAIRNLVLGANAMPTENDDYHSIFSSIERRLERLESKFDERIMHIEHRLSSLEATIARCAQQPINWNIAFLALVIALLVGIAVLIVARG